MIDFPAGTPPGSFMLKQVGFIREALVWLRQEKRRVCPWAGEGRTCVGMSCQPWGQAGGMSVSLKQHSSIQGQATAPG